MEASNPFYWYSLGVTTLKENLWDSDLWYIFRQYFKKSSFRESLVKIRDLVGTPTQYPFISLLHCCYCSPLILKQSALYWLQKGPNLKLIMMCLWKGISFGHPIKDLKLWKFTSFTNWQFSMIIGQKVSSWVDNPAWQTLIWPSRSSS